MKYTQDAFIERAKSVHGDRYDYSKVQYIDLRTPVLIICPKHGDFMQRPTGHLRGNGCRKCGLEQRRQTNLEKYGSESWASSKAAKVLAEQGGGPWAVDSRKKVANTCFAKFGAKTWAESEIGRETAKHNCADEHVRALMSERARSDVARQHYKETSLVNHGCEHWTKSNEGKARLHELFSTDEERKARSERMLSFEVRSKIQATSMERYGVPYYWQSDDAKERLRVLLSDDAVQNKIIATKKKRGTINSSYAEKLAYDLLIAHFGPDDVDPQHGTDSRYPYNCDFYIRSLDLFIEINASWMHGGHWFDSEDHNDMEKLSMWKSKTKPQYKQAIKVWTQLDLEKRNVAVQNGLNYLVFWDNDLSDFKDWLALF